MSSGFLSNTIFSVDRTPWLGPVYIFIKIFILLFGMIWVRATFPRIRYDRLMAFGWKVMLPLSLALIFITATFILLAQQVNNNLAPVRASRWFLSWQAYWRLCWCTAA